MNNKHQKTLNKLNIWSPQSSLGHFRPPKCFKVLHWMPHSPHSPHSPSPVPWRHLALGVRRHSTQIGIGEEIVWRTVLACLKPALALCKTVTVSKPVAGTRRCEMTCRDQTKKISWKQTQWSQRKYMIGLNVTFGVTLSATFNITFRGTFRAHYSQCYIQVYFQWYNQCYFGYFECYLQY